jgi:hypothetical protein
VEAQANEGDSNSARGEESRAEGDRPRPPSPRAMRYMKNTSKDQTRVVCPVQDAIGQMPPTRNHRSNTVWRDCHEPLLGPTTTTIMPGIDYPVNHTTYPNDCENTTCTKMGGHYQPGSWVIITENYDEGEAECFHIEYYTCTVCMEQSKRSFMGSRVVWKYPAEPMLAEKPLPPVPAQVHMPPKEKAPIEPVTTAPHVMAKTNGAPVVRIPGLPKLQSPMQEAIRRGTAMMAKVVQRSIPLEDIGKKLSWAQQTRKIRPWTPLKTTEG